MATMRFVSDYIIDDGKFKVNIWAAYPTRDAVSQELTQIYWRTYASVNVVIIA